MNSTLYDNLSATIRDLILGPNSTDRQSLMVLWGSRGSGKTAALSYLALNLSMFSQGPRVVALGPFDASVYTLEDYTHQISDEVAAAPGDTAKIVILLDNLDTLARAPEADTFYSFEQDTLVRLVQLENVTIVATSRAPLTWRDWETRSRHQTLAIPCIAKEEVQKQALMHQADPDDAFRLTLGHPQLLQWLFATPDISEAEIAARAATYFLEGLPVATAESATLMSLLPAFDVAVLRDVAPLNIGDIAEGFYSQYLDRIHDLIAAGILTWSADTGEYRFLDGVVRCHLARSFRYRRPDDAYRIHDRAASYFQAEAARPGVLQSFFVSVIYHLGFAAVVAGMKRPGQPAVDWIRTSLSGWANVRRSDVLEAWRTGAGDWIVRSELDRLIGAEDCAWITELMDTGECLMVESDASLDNVALGTEILEQEAAR